MLLDVLVVRSALKNTYKLLDKLDSFFLLREQQSIVSYNVIYKQVL